MTNRRKRSNTKVIIPCRIFYANIWKPKSVNHDEPKYSVSCVISKDDRETIAKIRKAIDAAKKDGKVFHWNGRIPVGLKLPLRDGDTDRPYDGNYMDSYFLNAVSRDAPQVVDRNVQPITNPECICSGCYCNVSVIFYPYNVNGNRGVGAGLGNIQFVRDAERLDGKANAEDEFDVLDDFPE